MLASSPASSRKATTHSSLVTRHSTLTDGGPDWDAALPTAQVLALTMLLQSQSLSLSPLPLPWPSLLLLLLAWLLRWPWPSRLASVLA